MDINGKNRRAQTSERSRAGDCAGDAGAGSARRRRGHEEDDDEGNRQDLRRQEDEAAR